MDDPEKQVHVPERSTPPVSIRSLVNLLRRKKIVLIDGIAILLLIIAGAAICFLSLRKIVPRKIACTQEAKQCPDGSYVSRIGPNCDFAPCPTPTPDPTANWETYTNQKYKYTLKYPDDGTFKQFTCGEKPSQIGGEETFALIPSSVIWEPCTVKEWFYGIEVTVETGNSASKEYYSSEEFKQNMDSDWKVDAEPITIDGAVGIKSNLEYTNLNDPTGCCPDYVEVRVYKNGFTYIFTLGDKMYESVFDQILSTFKFLDEATPTPGGLKACVQVITPAKNPQTGECRQFPTPCDVPEGWVRVESCPAP